ncbi:Putative cyclase [Geodermatophilus africanus]|uniref:Putative cyclase n=1 Tax=Geodermatophilus africanus TaxID=1137993 RepID=A0A1H3PKZ8_9ACTN|nr:cyclase family protein [Geodermatophilus africanus]SDZ01648.1 Putative cyclase [Geodermatophilus africanus]
MTARPAFDDLPELDGTGVRHGWGVVPYDIGSIANVTPDMVREAAHQVRTGETIPLNLAVDAFDPPLFGRRQVEHTVVEAGRNELEDVLSELNPQASSQLDGLAHVRAREHGFLGGATSPDEARERSGMHHWARRGIAARGVLLDVERSRTATGTARDPFLGDPVHPDELLAVAKEQRVELRPGDALLVRTGWAAAYLAADDGARARGAASWNGLHAGEDTARFLWNAQVALLGCDNPAVENGPGDRAAGSLHRRVLPAFGLALMELLDLERLAARCAELERWEFLLVSVPVHVVGGVSSPANVMAVL